jgi:hypothetical protein
MVYPTRPCRFTEIVNTVTTFGNTEWLYNVKYCGARCTNCLFAHNRLNLLSRQVRAHVRHTSCDALLEYLQGWWAQVRIGKFLHDQLAALEGLSLVRFHLKKK